MTGGAGVGAYSDSRGVPGVRQEVARFIEERDGFPRLVPRSVNPINGLEDVSR
jgi:aspartate/methionine/tyrosine aminotransferase